MHEADLRFNVKACLEVLNGKNSCLIPGDWQREMSSKGQPHLIGGWSLPVCSLAGNLTEKLAVFPQEMC